MSNIMEYLNKIKKAVYGEEVRQSIHDAIQQCYYDGKAGAVDLEARQLLEAKADKTDVSTPYNFKGNCLFSELPAEGNSVNDTYYCTDMKCKYTWNSEAWYQSGLSEKEYVDELAQLSESMNENVSQLSSEIDNSKENLFNEITSFQEKSGYPSRVFMPSIETDNGKYDGESGLYIVKGNAISPNIPDRKSVV